MIDKLAELFDEQASAGQRGGGPRPHAAGRVSDTAGRAPSTKVPACAGMTLSL